MTIMTYKAAMYNEPSLSLLPSSPRSTIPFSLLFQFKYSPLKSHPKTSFLLPLLSLAFLSPVNPSKYKNQPYDMQ